MKRALSLILALAMVFTMAITVYAEEPDNKGSITISNATPGEDYRIYKIFDASIKLKRDENNQIVEDADGKPIVEGISYSIDRENNPYFDDLFGNGETPESDYFDYNPNAIIGNIAVKKDIKAEELIDFLTDMVENSGVAPTREHKNFQLHPVENDTDHTDDDDLVFTDLEYGYYVIVSSLGSAVTINSNTPNVEVIDKNQIPGGEFDKVLYDPETKETFEESSANIGDVVTYHITFEATNYAGPQQIKYYEVFDNKGTGIWAEFNKFQVYINDVPLKNGHYLNHGGLNTNQWGAIGEWEDNVEKKLENADWYLVHTGFDSYSILIPWLTDHYLEGEEPSQTIAFGENAVSKFESPVTVKIEYTAAVEPNANIGGGTGTNLFNTAELSWTTQYDTTTTPPQTVHSDTYGIGILKEDASTKENLAGAKFKLYKNYNKETNSYSDPLYVIPTGIDGLYIVDSKNTEAETVSGTYMETARKYFEYLRTPDGGYVKDDSDNKVENAALKALGDNQTNIVESQINGKFAILGLKLGTYYLQEIAPPQGYNALSEPVVVEITENSSSTFNIFAEADGDVADVQQEGSLYMKYSYKLTQATVQNSKGAELPSTGGEGRMMLITVGTMMAIFFAVLLITQKKMSIYRD